jgi:fumarate reductase iron-sulfur subunit
MAHPQEELLAVEIWRGGAEGAFQRYSVPRRENQTVLDVVTHVQRRIDPSLAYRFACRVGMCGSCAMTVNGRPRWTCRTHVGKVAQDGTLTLAPLANLPVVRDLVVDMAPFFDKWAKAHGRFVPPAKPAADFAPADFAPAGFAPAGFAIVPPASAARRAADAGIECIGCGVCHAACEVVATLPDYLGPAALNRAWTLVNDVRDGGGAQRLAAVAGDAGCHACHSQQGCRMHCPKQLNPTAAIAGLKRATTWAALRGKL